MKSAQPAPTAEPTEQASQAEQASQEAAASQDSMQAIVQHRYGTVPEEVLRLERIARPRPAAGEVLVKVMAAGVDRGTWHMMAGQPYLMRLGLGFRRPRIRSVRTTRAAPAHRSLGFRICCRSASARHPDAERP